MEELKKIEMGMVPVYETSTGEKVVYGTELYTILEAKSNYREWVRRRFKDIDAMENEDYNTVEISTLAGGTPRKEHIIKLDIAKEMAMLERNEKGREVSRYLNAIERRKDMDNKVSVFKNGDLDLEMRTILNDDGSISVNAEDVARGLGWTTVAKSGNEVVRWARMNEYCKEFGFSPLVGKADYIPESLFYMLAMKANNERAQRFQKWIAIDVVPSIRKTGSYREMSEEVRSFMEKQLQFNQEILQKIDDAKDKQEANAKNPFSLTDFSERKEKLNSLVSEVARLCKLDKSKVLYYLYRTIEENLKISVDGIKLFYRLETGNEASTFETVIQNNHLYIEAVRLCEETIERKKIFG